MLQSPLPHNGSGEAVDSHTEPSKFWALATAAYHVYREVTGRYAQISDIAEANAVLHDVARALSNVVPIYSLNRESETYKQLEPVDLLFGVFQRGATVLRTPRAEYTHLAIRRDDMRAAITILKNAEAKFLMPPNG